MGWSRSTITKGIRISVRSRLASRSGTARSAPQRYQKAVGSEIDAIMQGHCEAGGVAFMATLISRIACSGMAEQNPLEIVPPYSTLPNVSAMKAEALRPLPVRTAMVRWSGVMRPLASRASVAAAAVAEVGSA